MKLTTGDQPLSITIRSGRDGIEVESNTNSVLAKLQIAFSMLEGSIEQLKGEEEVPPHEREPYEGLVDALEELTNDLHLVMNCMDNIVPASPEAGLNFYYEYRPDHSDDQVIADLDGTNDC